MSDVTITWPDSGLVSIDDARAIFACLVRIRDETRRHADGSVCKHFNCGRVAWMVRRAAS